MSQDHEMTEIDTTPLLVLEYVVGLSRTNAHRALSEEGILIDGKHYKTRSDAETVRLKTGSCVQFSGSTLTVIKAHLSNLVRSQDISW